MTASPNATGRCTAHPAYEADYCPRCGPAVRLGSDPTPAQVIEAAGVIGEDMVELLTDGLGLSGATLPMLRRIVEAAQAERASRRHAAQERGIAETDSLLGGAR